jgi:hypothetical protein
LDLCSDPARFSRGRGHAEGDELTQRASKWALSIATAFACLAFPGTASAFSPELAHPVEASSGAAALPPAPEPSPVVQAPPVSASSAQPEVDETVVAEEYQSAIDAAPTPVDPPVDALAPASEHAESGRQLGEPHEPIAPDAARNHDPGDPRLSELKLLRRVGLDGSTRANAGEAARRWHLRGNLQYHSAINSVPRLDMLREKISSHLSSRSSSFVRRDAHWILGQIRVTTRTDEEQHHLLRTARTRGGPSHCDGRDFQQAAGVFGKAAAWKAGKLANPQQFHLVKMVLKAKDSEMIEAVGPGLGFRAKNAGLFDCAAGHSLSSNSGRTPRSPMLEGESEATRSTSPPSAGEPSVGLDITAPSTAVKVLPRPKSLDTTIVGPLRRILPTRSVRPSPEVAEGLTDTRRLVQIGLVLGMAYVAFLTFWFWGTRTRGHRAGDKS